MFVTEFLRHSSIEVLDLDDDGNCGVLSELGVNEVVNVLVAETFECDIGDWKCPFVNDSSPLLLLVVVIVAVVVLFDVTLLGTEHVWFNNKEFEDSCWKKELFDVVEAAAKTDCRTVVPWGKWWDNCWVYVG